MSEENDDEIRALKEEVFSGVLKWSAWGGVCVAALSALQAYGEPSLWPSAFPAIALGALLPVFVFLPRLFGRQRSALAFLSYLLLACGYLLFERGSTAGVAMVTVAVLLVSGLLFGPRGARWGFVTSLATLGVAGVFSTSELAGPWPSAWVDPHNPIVWLRNTTVLFFFGGSLSFAFTKLITGLMQSRQALSTTLESERKERKQRERVEEALDQAQRLEALAQYAGGLAHDFNNTLMVIISGTSLIADDPQLSQRSRALALEIGNSAEASAEMVKHLLTLGRKSSPQRQPIRADTIVQQCRGTLRKVLPAGVNLSFEIDPEATLMVDVAALQQALLNLTLNARDALGETGSFILRAERRAITTVPAGCTARPGAFVVISCQDTGSGMDEATRTRLFEPFFTTKEVGHGTGLGLAMVRRFVDEAGGFISVESELQVGTTFRLHFPAIDPHARDAAGAHAGLALPS